MIIKFTYIVFIFLYLNLVKHLHVSLSYSRLFCKYLILKKTRFNIESKVNGVKNETHVRTFILLLWTPTLEAICNIEHYFAINIDHVVVRLRIKIVNRSNELTLSAAITETTGT